MSKILPYLLFAVGLLAVAFWSQSTHPQLAYVRSEVLINEFAGMQEARQQYQQKQQEWQAHLDTLHADYTRLEQSGGSVDELTFVARNIQQYTARMEQLAQEEDQQMTQAVLDQVNAFVEQYGQEQGYDLIMGTTQSGSILYGNAALDITEELLTALNHHYNPARYDQ